MCDNFVHLVLARTPGAPKGFEGISLFLVPNCRLSDDGGVGAFNDVVCAEVVEARFYFNKIETARFFVHQILTGNAAITAAIKSGDRSALEYHP